MAGTDPANEISELSSTLTSVESVLDPEAMRREADNLRERAADPGLWDDQERAQAVTRRLSYLEGELSRLGSLRRRLDDTRVMFELAESEHDEPTREEATRDLAALRKEIDQLEVRTLLSGEYDAREALITINAQAGGADAADWARRNESAVQRAGQTLTEIWESDRFTVAMLSVAVRAIRTLVDASSLPEHP